MTTLTEARRDLTEAVATLRGLGCTVGAVIGHDLRAGAAHYAIRPPKGIDVAEVGRSLTIYGVGSLRMLGTGDGVKIVTERPTRYVGLGSEETWRSDVTLRLKEAAALMRRLAGRIRSFDRTSSASSQHYIETGCYLVRTVTTVEEIRALPDMSRIHVPDDDFPADFIKVGPDEWLPDIDHRIYFGSEELASYGVVVVEVGP